MTRLMYGHYDGSCSSRSVSLWVDHTISGVSRLILHAENYKINNEKHSDKVKSTIDIERLRGTSPLLPATIALV